MACATESMVPGSLHVFLMSGRGVELPASMELSLKHVRLQAQSALHTGTGVLRDSMGRALDDRQTVAAAGLRPGDVLTLQVRQTLLASNKSGKSIRCHHRGWIRCHLGGS